MRRDNGEGSIWYNSKRKLWMAKYVVYDNNNKPVRKSVYAKTKEEIQSKLVEIQYKRNNKEYIQKYGIPLVELIKQNREKKFKANIISESQYDRIGHIIKNIENTRIGKMNVDTITSDDIQESLNSCTHYSNSTIKKIYEQLSIAFKSAMKNKYILSNPLEDVMKPKSDKENKIIKAFSIEQQKIFTKYLLKSGIEKEKYKNAMLIQLYMGLRIGEVLGLRQDDIDLENNLLYVRRTLTKNAKGRTKLGEKTKSYAGRRTLPIPSFFVGILEEQLNVAEDTNNGILFLNGDKLVNPSNINSQFKRILRNLNMYEEGLSTHSLRHSYGTRCIESHMPPVVLQRLMGHTDIKITLNTYTEIFNRFKQEEIEKVSNYYEKNNILDNLER